jgi:acetyl-CoA carboxylase alpha subunit
LAGNYTERPDLQSGSRHGETPALTCGLLDLQEQEIIVIGQKQRHVTASNDAPDANTL